MSRWELLCKRGTVEMAMKDKRWGESRNQLWKPPDNKFWHMWKEKGKEGLGEKIFWQSTVRESFDHNGAFLN